MLSTDCFLPAFVQLSKPASRITSIGFVWNGELGENGEMVKLNRKKMRFHKITTYMHGLSVASMLLQTVLVREKDLSKVLISSFGLIVLVFTTITVWVYHNNLEGTMHLINDLVRASHKYRESGTIKLDAKEKFIKFMAPLFHWSAMSVPFAFVGGVVWSMPCTSSSFGYLLLNECTWHWDHSTPFVPTTKDHLSKLVFIMANLILWVYSIQCAVFTAIGVAMLGAMSVRSFLKYYEKKMLETPISRHDNPKLAYNNAVIYRQLQLLTERLNIIHGRNILVPLLITVTSHQIFSVYGIIKFKGQLNFMSYCLFTILASQGFLVIMGMFTALADVHTISVRVKRNLEKAHRSHKWLRRFHKSCTQVKIRFGALNYIDSFTPLSFENFALMQTTNMLLVD